MQQRKATCVDIVQETSDTRTLWFTIEPAFDFVPGQFITFLVNKDGQLHRRPYSMCTAPEQKDRVAVTIKVYNEGKISPTLYAMQIGQQFDIIGPFGRFLFEEKEQYPVFIGAGSGIVPLMSMIKHGLHHTDDFSMTLLYSNKTEQDIIYGKELAALADKHDSFTYVPTLTRCEDASWQGMRGRITPAMIADNVDVEKSFFYVCGPPAFCADIIAHLTLLGVAKERFKREEYD